MKKFDLRAFAHRKDVRILSLTALAVLASTLSADAQTGGLTGGFAKAASDLKSYLPLVQKIIFALAWLLFLLGGASIYIKMSNGEQDVKSSIMMFVGGVLFLLIVGGLAPTIFG